LSGVATAWCGIQASQWNGKEAEESRDAGIARTDASQEFVLATQIFAYDADMTTQYAQVLAAGDAPTQASLRKNLVRPGFLPVLDSWEAAVVAGDQSSLNLFNDQAYIDALFAESTAAEAESEAALVRSNQASENGDSYLLTTLLTTLLTATALFFAGVTSSFTSRPAQLALLSIVLTIIVLAAARLTDLPVV